MTYRAPAVHRTIVALDVQAFGAPRRTNRDQVAVRDGLYRATQEAFRQAGISWAGCDHEDRGDGMLVLIGPEVPKGLLVESLPAALANALRMHNGEHLEGERIQLRMALHAGEVNYDGHGATAAAINLTFRLLESDAVKHALADSASVLAVITSSWFFEEVVRHSTADASAFHPAPVTVKETVTTGWIWLEDHGVRPGSGQLSPVTPAGDQMMTMSTAQPGDASAVTHPGASAAVGGAGDEPTVSGDSGLPVTVPLGRLPVDVRGRDGLLTELCHPLRSYRRGSPGTWVLAGMGGVGKSTVALAVAQKAQARGWRVWWVNAADITSFTGGMLELLHQLNAPESVTRPVREGTPLAAERAWAFLNGRQAAGRRWLLIFDNADTPAILAAQGAATPGDHAGWVRPGPSGLVIVTTRTKDPHAWGPQVRLRELRPLEPSAAAQVLIDLAPGISDPDGRQAEELGRRLGGLPLALHLAGNYLASPFARWHSFDDYRQALESDDLPLALADLENPSGHDRTAISRTWELSLNALTDAGQPQARTLLWLLSCYAPTTPIPMALLNPERLAELSVLGSGLESSPESIAAPRVLRDGVHGLAAVGLTELVAGQEPAVIMHPVVADASRSRLLTTAGSELSRIAEAAVGLLKTAAGTIDHQHPADWPVWHQLTPHVTALLEWLGGHLNPPDLETLVAISVRTAKAERRSGNLATAEKLAELGVAKAALLGDSHVASLTARYALGQVVAAQGRNSEAEQIYRHVLILQQHVLGHNHPDTLNTRHHLASMINYQGRYHEAEEMYHQVLAGQQQVLGIDAEATLNTRHHLAWMTGLRGCYVEAGQQFQTIITAQRRILGDDHPDTLRARYGLAWVKALNGQYASAEEQFRNVLSDQRRILGNDHPDTMETRYRLARAIADQGRYHEARAIYLQVLKDMRRTLGDEHPATLAVRDNLARVTGLEGRHREAEQMFRQVLADREKLLAEGHPHILLTQHRLAQAVASQGRLSEAEQMFRQVLAAQKHLLGHQHPATLGTYFRLAQVLAGQGQNGEAEQMFRETLTAQENLLGHEHPDTISTRTQLLQITTLHKAPS